VARSAGAIRAEDRLKGREVAAEVAAVLGKRVRDTRRRRQWSQKALGRRVGLSPAWISSIEHGSSVGVPLDVWFGLGQALGLPLKVEFGRDATEEPFDAGHLGMQELALRLGRETGRARTFELPTKPANPSFSIDVCLRDDAQRVLIIEECWNSFGNINASVRSTRRKIAEAEEMAVAIGGDAGPYRVAAVWIVRDTRRNREILARYPEVFGSAFTGSSAAWVRALTTKDAAVPEEPGLVWSDVRATRIFAWRRPRG
jgi:transcriptional regulator with XRE-family HTH domain